MGYLADPVFVASMPHTMEQTMHPTTWSAIHWGWLGTYRTHKAHQCHVQSQGASKQLWLRDICNAARGEAFTPDKTTKGLGHAVPTSTHEGGTHCSTPRNPCDIWYTDVLQETQEETTVCLSGIRCVCISRGRGTVVSWMRSCMNGVHDSTPIIVVKIYLSPAVATLLVIIHSTWRYYLTIARPWFSPLCTILRPACLQWYLFVLLLFFCLMRSFRPLFFSNLGRILFFRIVILYRIIDNHVLLHHVPNGLVFHCSFHPNPWDSHSW